MDFRAILVPIRSLPRGTSVGITDVQKGSVRLSKVKFPYNMHGSGNSKVEADAVAWSVFQPVLEERINALGAEGWELESDVTTSLGYEHFGEQGLSRMPLLIHLLLLVITLGLWLVIWGAQEMLGKNQYYTIDSARLTFKRQTAM